MRVLRHPQIVESVRDWLRRTDAFAREQERAAERARSRAPIDQQLVEDHAYFCELLDGCVLWVRLALPPIALPIDADDEAPSPELIALRRLGVTEAQGVTVDEVLRRHYLRVLEACDERTSLAARLLGVNRRTIQRFLSAPAKGRRR
jgi:hypothetical protein